MFNWKAGVIDKINNIMDNNRRTRVKEEMRIWQEVNQREY